MRLGPGPGLDAALFAKVLSARLGDVDAETKPRESLLPRDDAGGFARRLQALDLQLTVHLCRLAGVEVPQLALCTGRGAVPRCSARKGQTVLSSSRPCRVSPATRAGP